MKVRVLGCSGAIAKDCRTTSFLVNDNILIDAGTGVGDLTLEEMRKIDHVFLTHSHLDHIAGLPLMLDAISSQRQQKPVQIHGLPETIAALREHVFNDVIWPDFSRLPSVDCPFLSFVPLQVGERWLQGDLTVEALPALHTVPAVGYAIEGKKGWWVYSGDTAENIVFWERINELPVSVLIMETAFSEQEAALARLSQHLSPRTLLSTLRGCKHFPLEVFVTHTKPAETEIIMNELHDLMNIGDGYQAKNTQQALRLHCLRAGHVFSV